MKTPGDLRKYSEDFELDEAVQNFLHCYGAPSYREHIYNEVIKRLANQSRYIGVLKLVIKEYLYATKS